MIEENNILETINMIKLYNLDIRTVTLALSLRDCISEDIDRLCDNIYTKIKKYAKNLVSYADELADEYSIPIINKRISVTPISIIGESCKNPDYVKIAKVLDMAAKEGIEGFKADIYRNLDEYTAALKDLVRNKEKPDALTAETDGDGQEEVKDKNIGADRDARAAALILSISL